MSCGSGQTKETRSGADHATDIRGQRGCEGCEVIAPLKLSAGLRGERGLGLEAAREQYAVGGEFDARRPIEIADADTLDLATAFDGDDRRRRVYRDAERTSTIGSQRFGPRIDDGLHPDASGVQRKDRFVSPIGVCEQHGTLADGNAIASQIGERGARKHDSRQVVVDASEQPLVGAAREQYASRTNDAQSLPRQIAGLRVGVGQGFDGAEDAMVIGRNDLRARQHTHHWRSRE